MPPGKSRVRIARGCRPFRVYSLEFYLATVAKWKVITDVEIRRAFDDRRRTPLDWGRVGAKS
jgi:hypothetical protein